LPFAPGHPLLLYNHFRGFVLSVFVMRVDMLQVSFLVLRLVQFCLAVENLIF